MKVFTQKKYQDHIPCSFAYKLVCVDDKFSKPIVVFRGENAAYKFFEAILEAYVYCKKVMKKHFNKSLIVSEEEEQFQSSSICWICEKLIKNDNENLEAQLIGIVNVNLQLAKRISATFHNLRGYDSYLIFCELNKFDVKIHVIANGLEKYIVFFLIKT